MQGWVPFRRSGVIRNCSSPGWGLFGVGGCTSGGQCMGLRLLVLSVCGIAHERPVCVHHLGIFDEMLDYN